MCVEQNERRRNTYIGSPQCEQKVTVYDCRPTPQRCSTAVGQVQMNDEGARLATFMMYDPPPGVWLLLVAQNGFYFLQDGSGKLKCAFCNVTVQIEHLSHRSPVEIHKDVSPLCPFLQSKNTSNIPFEQRGHLSGQNFVTKHLGGALQDMSHNRQLSVSNSDLQSKNTSYGDSPSGPSHSHLSPLTGDHSSFSGTNEGPANRSAEPSPRYLDATATESPAIVCSQLQDASANQSGEQARGTENRMKWDTSPCLQTAEYLGRDSQTPVDSYPLQATPSSRNEYTQQLETNEPSRASSQQASLHSENASIPPPVSSSAPVASKQANSMADQPPAAGTEPRVVTYAQVGIITTRPKRPDLVITSTRTDTFHKCRWPHMSTHAPERMAEAGFYFTGKGDLVRCFYCNRGLKSWSEDLDSWVEHVRWFPDCAYVMQVKSADYIEAVQSLHNKSSPLSLSEVENKLKQTRKGKPHLKKDTLVTHNVKDKEATNEGNSLSHIMTESTELEKDYFTGMDDAELAKQEEVLKMENETILSETTCKICQCNDANILFLPCGHLVSCAQCAPALRKCAICRMSVKGVVRVNTDDLEEYDTYTASTGIQFC